MSQDDNPTAPPLLPPDPPTQSPPPEDGPKASLVVVEKPSRKKSVSVTPKRGPQKIRARRDLRVLVPAPSRFHPKYQVSIRVWAGEVLTDPAVIEAAMSQFPDGCELVD
jgi:hypothetical protein